MATVFRLAESSVSTIHASFPPAPLHPYPQDVYANHGYDSRQYLNWLSPAVEVHLRCAKRLLARFPTRVPENIYFRNRANLVQLGISLLRIRIIHGLQAPERIAAFICF